jgi:hypothetical protein
MTLESGDPACLAALTQQLGHEEPFTEEEVSKVESLTVTGAQDLSPLEACTRLRHLRVIGSDVPDFNFCEMTPELAHLEVFATRVGSMAGAAHCRKLERIDLLYTSLTDSADLLGVSSFKRGTIIGNPWGSGSWSYLQGECSKPHMFVELPTVHDWKLTCTLWEKYEACWGPIAQSLTLLVRPGLPQYTQNPFDALALTSIRHEMNQADFSIEKLFREYANLVTAPDLSEMAQWHTLGSSAEAEQWIAASSFPDDEKAALTRFAKRFPKIPFYFSSQALIDLQTKDDKFASPGWYLDLRRTLDGWLPNSPSAPVRFGGDLHWAVAGKHYYLGQYPHAAEYEDKLVATGFVNVALSVEDAQAMLAMSLNDGDRQIYAYSFEDVSDAISEGRDPAASFYVAFPSYADMLDHIVAILPQDKDPITAA